MRDRKRRFHALYDKLYLPYILECAWKRVKRNRGSAGIDGQTLEEIGKLGVERFLVEIAQALQEKSYTPHPVRRVEIPKPGDAHKKRPLGIPCVRDRVIQAAAKLVLEPIFEADFEGCSFGFRPGIGQHEALAAIEEQSRQGYRWVVDADIEGFFDNLDHDLLMEALRRRIADGAMLRLIYRWLKAGYLLLGEYHSTDQGSPQGGVLSPLLANVYLHAFDKAARTQKRFIGRLTRYADDFVIQCGTQDHARRALEWVQEQLERLKLRLHPTKTRIVNDRLEGFDFLGFHHRRIKLRQGRQCGKESWGTLRWPSAKACAHFRKEVGLRLLPLHRLRSDWREILQELAAYLRGWSQYFRHGQSARVFHKLDRFVSMRLARNLARSQPSGKKRRKRTWLYYLRHRSFKAVPTLAQISKGPYAAYQGQAKAGWRAV